MQITRVGELADEPAVTIAARTLSYSQLRGAAGALAQKLAGIERVGVWAHSSLATVVAVVAALESGVEVVPLNPKLGSAELEHILSDAQPQLIIGADAGSEPRAGAADAAGAAGAAGAADASGAATLATIPQLRVDLDAHGELPPAPQDPEAVALIVYTSGTTGAPKGVLMPRRAITSNLDAIADVWGWTGADSLAHALPLFHVHGLVLGTLGPLRIGGHLHHLQSFSAESVTEAFAGADTMMFGVPTMYHRLAEAAEQDQELRAALARARLLVSGSAPLPARTFTRIEALTGQRIVERYGLTETLMNTAVRHDGERRPGEVGLPVPGVEVKVVLEDGAAAPLDGSSIGEVVVRGPNLFRGYLNRPDATAQVVKDGWFWTGDMATLAPDGYLRIVGRKSTDIIKTGGFKVGAGEIEGALLEHPSVSEAAVKGVPDDDLGERITAWVVLRAGAPVPTATQLSDHVTTLLSAHKRPRGVIFVEELPRNAMGKVVKQRLTP